MTILSLFPNQLIITVRRIMFRVATLSVFVVQGGVEVFIL